MLPFPINCSKIDFYIRSFYLFCCWLWLICKICCIVLHIMVKNRCVQLTESLGLVFRTAWKNRWEEKTVGKTLKLLMWKTLSETDMLQIMIIIYKGKCFHEALITDRHGRGHAWYCLWLLRWILTQNNRKWTCCSFSIILMMITLGAFSFLFTFPSQ